MPEVTLLPRTPRSDISHNLVTLRERLTDHLPYRRVAATRERLWKVRATQVILATGAHERPLVFGNNDLPGVMLASARDILNRYGVPGGERVIFTNNDEGYRAALDLQASGRCDVAVVGCRAARVPVELPRSGRAPASGLTVHGVMR